MINFIKKIFGFRYKDTKPVFPSTPFYIQKLCVHNNNELKLRGWTKEEIRQGWRWLGE